MLDQRVSSYMSSYHVLQVLERQAVAEQFQKVNAGLERTLDALRYEDFASDEVKEQVSSWRFS